MEENKEVQENLEKEETELMVQDFSSLQKKTNTKQKFYTTITDNKKIFNLENTCDFKINDCKGEKIKIKDVMIKIIEKPLENPEVNEETGEVKDTEIKMVTILIDEDEKSYVTGSKSFALQLMKYIEMFGIEDTKGLVIEFTDRQIKNSSNKVLAFKIVE